MTEPPVLQRHSKRTEPRYHSPTKQSTQPTIIEFNTHPTLHEQDDIEARYLIPRLAARAFHLRGNTWCQDWRQFLMNNHPLFGIFCHHRLHPLRLGQRIVCLVGSIAFGLTATTCVNLYYEYDKTSDNDTVFTLSLAGREWELTRELVAHLTFAGLFHSMFDISLWFMSACICCLPGGSCEKYSCGKQIGSYVVVVIVAMLVALATFVVILTASMKSRGNTLEEEGIDSVTWGSINNVSAFSFVVSYLGEFVLALLVILPVMMTVLFTGVLGCRTLPFLGGRPKQVKVDTAQRMKDAKDHRHGLEFELSFEDEDVENTKYSKGRH